MSQENIVKELVKIMTSAGLEVYMIGTRSIIFHGVDLGRETKISSLENLVVLKVMSCEHKDISDLKKILA
ncbi:MAG: hypothetical protein DRN04_09720 [Thermoprotei archaeon]|nr:MAG: hypothetical protein DRN04_09720 [Thermoprotei archaeon]